MCQKLCVAFNSQYYVNSIRNPNIVSNFKEHLCISMGFKYKLNALLLTNSLNLFIEFDERYSVCVHNFHFHAMRDARISHSTTLFELAYNF